MTQYLLQLRYFFKENKCIDWTIECFERHIKMIENIDCYLLCNYIIDVAIVFLFVVFDIVSLVLLIFQFEKNPCIFFILFLYETAVVQEYNHLLWVFLSLLLCHKWAGKLIHTFSHSHSVAFLLNWIFVGQVSYYLRLLNIRLNRLLFLWFESRIIK